MKKSLQFAWMLWSGVCICTGLTVAQNSKPSASAEKPCGPPEYCAHTDRKVEVYPSKPPAIGPAGSIVTDPNFGSRILRVTDEKSDPHGKSSGMVTPSSAEQNNWNSTSTRFYVIAQGGRTVMYDFDPATMKAHQTGPLNAKWGAEPQFSYTLPNILYGVDKQTPVIQQYDLSNDKLTTIQSASDCLKLNPADNAHDITAAADDNRFMTTIGPEQDNNYIVYVYDRAQGCRWYNTQTGEIGGKWGSTGTTPMPDRFLIHNARMSKSGKYVYVARGNSSAHHRWVVWEIDTMNVALCPDKCTGHRVLGYSHVISPSGAVNSMDLLMRPLNNLDKTQSLVPQLAKANYWYDLHFSWNNANPEDTTPVCFSTYRPANPNAPGAPLAVDGPWENEIDCAETDLKAFKIWRFAHTYSTAKNGFWSTPRGNVSQDGKFFIFTSDWQDQLGEEPNGKKYRTDAFIVELK